MIKKFLIPLILIISTNAMAATPFTLTSTTFKEDQLLAIDQVYNRSDCKGKNISPELSWSNAPASTKSFAVTMFDPDAPKGWWHWVVFNIPANVYQLKLDAGNPQSDKLPASAIQSITDFGAVGYGGPCPPKGDKPHRYVFTVYALKSMLSLNEKSSTATVRFAIHKNNIAHASLTGTYQQ